MSILINYFHLHYISHDFISRPFSEVNLIIFQTSVEVAYPGITSRLPRDLSKFDRIHLGWSEAAGNS